LTLKKLETLFAQKNNNVLNVYFTACYPTIDSTTLLLQALQDAKVDIIEVGMPYSDPIADGEVIQQSNMQALQNGFSIDFLFKQLQAAKKTIHVPIILMGYLNPVLQYGIENFCNAAAQAGVAGVILPDLPMQAYEKSYKKYFDNYNLDFIFLVTPQTTTERIKEADALSTGFVYVVSSSSTTGASNATEDKIAYFKKIQKLKLNNPTLIGFGIHDAETYNQACHYANGAIIGSAFIKAISGKKDVTNAAKTFIKTIR
jgi:tryptophan synthase alpha chain